MGSIPGSVLFFERAPTVTLGDVVDELHDEDSFPHACPAEQSNLPALLVRREQVHNLRSGWRRLRKLQNVPLAACVAIAFARFVRVRTAFILRTFHASYEKGTRRSCVRAEGGRTGS